MITKRSADNEADWAKTYPNKPNEKVIFLLPTVKITKQINYKKF